MPFNNWLSNQFERTFPSMMLFLVTIHYLKSRSKFMFTVLVMHNILWRFNTLIQQIFFTVGDCHYNWAQKHAVEFRILCRPLKLLCIKHVKPCHVHRGNSFKKILPQINLVWCLYCSDQWMYKVSINPCNVTANLSRLTNKVEQTTTQTISVY